MVLGSKPVYCTLIFDVIQVKDLIRFVVLCEVSAISAVALGGTNVISFAVEVIIVLFLQNDQVVECDVWLSVLGPAVGHYLCAQNRDEGLYIMH